MAVLLITGILIANIPGITVTHLFLFYGTLRASTLLPTVMTLKGVRLNAKGIITGVVAALAGSTFLLRKKMIAGHYTNVLREKCL